MKQDTKPLVFEREVLRPLGEPTGSALGQLLIEKERWEETDPETCIETCPTETCPGMTACPNTSCHS